MGNYEYLELQLEDGILTLIINRPERLNALNMATIAEIRTVFEKVVENEEVKGVIITGAGEKAFIAGADIKEIASLDQTHAKKLAEHGQETFAMIENCEKPVIAAINGFALGGGCELAMACHLRLASSNAKFGQPEVNLGLLPGYGGTQRLTQLIGKGKAMELIMTGDLINAEEAKQLGLVNNVSDDIETLMNSSLELMNKIISKAPLAIGMVIRCVNTVGISSENGYQIEANSFAHCCQTDDFKEGTAAFIEKRKPVFTGK